MKKVILSGICMGLLSGCFSDAYWSGFKEGLGLGSDVDYFQCKQYEDKAKDPNLPSSMREQAFKDLSSCRETAKSLQKSK